MSNGNKIAAENLLPDISKSIETPTPAVALAGVWFCPVPLDDGPDDACLDIYCEAEKLFIQLSQQIYNGNTHDAGRLVADLCRALDAAIDARQGDLEK